MPVGHIEITLCQWDTKEICERASHTSAHDGSCALSDAKPGGCYASDQETKKARDMVLDI